MPQKSTATPDVATSTDLMAICHKSMLTAKEAALYLGVSLSTLYKWMCKGLLGYSKPTGKNAYFNRLELEAWMQRNRVATAQEIEAQAQAYCVANKKGGVA